MKVLPSILLVISSSNFHAVAGSGIRGVETEMEEGTQQQQRSRDLAENDSKGLFGDEIPDEAESVAESSDEEDDEDSPALPAKKVDKLADARLTAEMLNLSLDDAQELLRQQQDFANVVDDLQEDTDFLQAEMPSEPNGEFVVKYKNGNIPKKSQKAIKQFAETNKNEVKSVPTKLSLKDAESRGQRLSEMLESKGYSNVSFSIDGDGIEVIAKKSRGQGKGAGNGKIPDARIAGILDLEEDDGDLEKVALFLVEHDDDDPAQPNHTFGGRKITGGGYQCTTAFSVTGSGTTGISTAAHCTGMNWYDAHPAEADYSIYFQREHRGLYGDVQWHTTPHWDVAEYYSMPNTRWPVRSVGSSISNNQVICGYSRMQGIRRCDRVRSTSVSVHYSGHPRMYNLVAMRSRMMIGGDSGGPWSYYDRAYGVQSGYTTICDSRFLWWRWNCHQRDIWSRVSYFGAALGVTVRTM